MNQMKNPSQEGPKPQEKSRPGGITPLGRSHQEGWEVCWVVNDNLPGVEIAIAGDVEKMVGVSHSMLQP